MCGICGFINRNGKPASGDVLMRMNRALTHRGPDGDGIFVSGAFAMGMRRLAIIDLQSGNQPIFNEDKTIAIVFNGEIYNSPLLRENLEKNGHRFSTRSDTETIVHQFEENGADCVKFLRGMFAFAIYQVLDQESGKFRLMLARDRMGIKPLYYYMDSNVLIFSSELTSLVQHPLIHREIEPIALRRYLETGIVASPLTLFKNVSQLLPGERLCMNNGCVTLEKYWELPIQKNDKLLAFPELAASLRTKINESVKTNLLSDVPVGALLSGGLDSSTVVAFMARNSAMKIPTFSIRFEDAEYDESVFARKVAEEFCTDHHEFSIKNQSFDYDLLLSVITHHGQPTADSSAIPTFIVSQLARKFVKVVLSGDGGDECFAGYSHFGWVTQIRSLYRFPLKIRRALLALARSIARQTPLRTQFWRQIINALEVSMSEKSSIPYQVLRLTSNDQVDSLLLTEWNNQNFTLDGLLQDLDDLNSADPLNAAQRFAFRYFLPDAYLNKVDRMSMANSLEVRVPLLDHELVEFSLSIPSNIHWSKGINKRLLRAAVADLLPPALFGHRKQGFSIPLHRWASGKYYDLANELLMPSAVRKRGLFKPEVVQQILRQARAENGSQGLESKYRSSHRLYALVVLELWCRLYIDSCVSQPSEANQCLQGVILN